MKRILILSSDNILSASIQRLLTRELGFDPIHIAVQENISSLGEIDLDQVRVIILNGSKKHTQFNLLVKMLQLSKELKLIYIDSEGNHAQVIEKQELLIRSTADLCAAIGNP